MRIKKIDRVGELVEQLAKMTADYSDAIGIMRGQFMSLLEVEVTTETVETIALEDSKEKSGHHHHHHHRHRDSKEQTTQNLLESSEGATIPVSQSPNLPDAPESELVTPEPVPESAFPNLRRALTSLPNASSNVSAPGKMPENSLMRGIDMLDLENGREHDSTAPSVTLADQMLGGQALLQSDGSTTPSPDGKLKRRLFPGGKQAVENPAIPFKAVSAPVLDSSKKPTSSRTRGGAAPSSRSHHDETSEEQSDQEGSGNGAAELPSPDGSVGNADGLLMQAHEKRMDDVIHALETLIKMVEDNFERVRELKRELDIFLEVDAESREIPADQRMAFEKDSKQKVAEPELPIENFPDHSLPKDQQMPQKSTVDNAVNSGTVVKEGELATEKKEPSVDKKETLVEKDRSFVDEKGSLIGKKESSIEKKEPSVGILPHEEPVARDPAVLVAESEPSIVNTEVLTPSEPAVAQPEPSVVKLSNGKPMPAIANDPMTEMQVDAGLALDIAQDLQYVIMDIEGIRGTRRSHDHTSEPLVDEFGDPLVLDADKLSLWEAMGKTIRKSELTNLATAVEKITAARKALLPGDSTEDALDACMMLDRFTRQAKRNRYFFQNYYPPKPA